MSPRQWFAPVRHLVRKEFRQLLRDKQMLRMICVMPLVQLLVLGYATTTDLKNIRLTILDQDRTAQSRALLQSFYQNDLFIPGPPAENPEQLHEQLFRGGADAVLWIPRGYATALASGNTAELGMSVDGVNSNAAGRTLGYAQALIRQEEARIMEARRLDNPNLKIHRIEPVTRNFYNPQLESRYYMIPAIMVILISMIGGMMSGMAVVREKEVGTLEQLMVTPLTPGQLIVGKLVPFAVLSFVELAVAMVLALAWFAVPLQGSVLLLFGSAFIFLFVTLGGGLMASTVSQTQQQAMFTIWFFTIFGILTSGFFYPVENMPGWIYYLTYLNPLRFFMNITRGIFLKGVHFNDIIPSLIPLLIMGTVMFTVAVRRFRKRLA